MTKCEMSECRVRLKFNVTAALCRQHLTLTRTMSDRQQLLSMGFGPEVRVDKAIRATGGKGLQAAMDCEQTSVVLSYLTICRATGTR